MSNILVLRDQKCVAFLNKMNLLQTENLCFHTQQLTCGSAHLLFGHILYSCCFLVLHGQASMQTYFCYKEKHLPLSHFTPLKIFLTRLLFFSQSAPLLPQGAVLCWKRA